jgi:hypothetical protein
MPDNGPDSESRCYVALHESCGGWLAVCMICPATDKDLGRWLKEQAEAGLTIKSLTVQAFRDGAYQMCECPEMRGQDV